MYIYKPPSFRFSYFLFASAISLGKTLLSCAAFRRISSIFACFVLSRFAVNCSKFFFFFLCLALFSRIVLPLFARDSSFEMLAFGCYHALIFHALKLFRRICDASFDACFAVYVLIWGSFACFGFEEFGFRVRNSRFRFRRSGFWLRFCLNVLGCICIDMCILAGGLSFDS